MENITDEDTQGKHAHGTHEHKTRHATPPAGCQECHRRSRPGRHSTPTGKPAGKERRRRREADSRLHCWWGHKMVRPLRKRVISLKKLNTLTTQSSNYTPGCSPPPKTCPHRNLHTAVQRSLACWQPHMEHPDCPSTGVANTVWAPPHPRHGSARQAKACPPT